MSSLDPSTFKFHNAKQETDPDSAYIFLDVSDRGIILPDDLDLANLPQRKILIYAETITLTKSLILPGKDIGIFCSNLALVPQNVAIDVSGAKGDGVAPVPSGPGTVGNPGKNAGSIWVYVEQMDEKLAAIVELRADGGMGGEGGATSDVAQRAGKGGTGGNAGEYPRKLLLSWPTLRRFRLLTHTNRHHILPLGQPSRRRARGPHQGIKRLTSSQGQLVDVRHKPIQSYPRKSQTIADRR
jgi:hypothetical protein